MKLAILGSLFLTIASAATLPVTPNSASLTSEDTHAVSYPETAQAIVGKARNQLSNAELLRMGQPLAKPAKLYDARSLKKRLDNAPAQASAKPTTGGVQRNYRFLACSDRVNEVGTQIAVSGTLQQQANQCATQSQTDGPAPNYPERFVIGSFRGNGFCISKVQDFIAVTCDTPNSYGIYEVIP